jgi:translocation and assembly module TamA
VVRSRAIGIAWLLCLLAGSPAFGAVQIEGVSDRLQQNIAAQLGLTELDCGAPGWLVRWEFREAEDDINRALEAMGYYDAVVAKSLDLNASECWSARFSVTLGKPVVVRAVDIIVDRPLDGEPLIKTRIEKAAALKGKRLNHGSYEELKRGLLEDARSLGYFDAVFTRSEVRVETLQHRAVIDLQLAGGDRYSFGAIDISGDVIERRLLNAYIPFASGDPFDAALVAKLRRNLADSGYFRRSVVIVDDDAAVDKRVPVRVELTPREPPWTYSVGVGYATDTGPRLRLGAQNQLINRAGHRVSIEATISPANSSLDFEYKMPHKNPMDDWFIFDAGIAHLDTDTSTSDITRVGARHTYPRGTWVESDFADLTHEDYRIAHENGRSNLMLFGTTWTRVERDRPLRPMAGYRIVSTLRGAAQTLGSDTNFAQIEVVGKYIHGIGEKIRAILRGDVGATWKEKFDALPPSVRFFAGGDTSIRGYAYQSIGPEQNGDVIGGSSLLVGSLELDYEFRPDWSVAAFVDSGSAYDDKPQFFTGVGAGVIYRSLVGPIRVYVGHPLEPENVEWRLAIVIGPDL